MQEFPAWKAIMPANDGSKEYDAGRVSNPGFHLRAKEELDLSILVVDALGWRLGEVDECLWTRTASVWQQLTNHIVPVQAQMSRTALLDIFFIFHYFLILKI